MGVSSAERDAPSSVVLPDASQSLTRPVDGDQPCTAGQLCVAGACGCADEKVLCGTKCVDLLKDKKHCGECDNKCGPGLMCMMGDCR